MPSSKIPQTSVAVYHCDRSIKDTIPLQSWKSLGKIIDKPFMFYVVLLRSFPKAMQSWHILASLHSNVCYVVVSSPWLPKEGKPVSRSLMAQFPSGLRTDSTCNCFRSSLYCTIIWNDPFRHVAPFFFVKGWMLVKTLYSEYSLDVKMQILYIWNCNPELPKGFFANCWITVDNKRLKF